MVGQLSSGKPSPLRSSSKTPSKSRSMTGDAMVSAMPSTASPSAGAGRWNRSAADSADTKSAAVGGKSTRFAGAAAPLPSLSAEAERTRRAGGWGRGEAVRGRRRAAAVVVGVGEQDEVGGVLAAELDAVIGRGDDRQ